MQQLCWEAHVHLPPLACDLQPRRLHLHACRDAEARIFLYENFLTDEECERWVLRTAGACCCGLAEARMQPTGLMTSRVLRAAVDSPLTARPFCAALKHSQHPPHAFNSGDHIIKLAEPTMQRSG